MVEEPVGGEALVDDRMVEAGRGCTAASRGPARRVDDDPARLDEALFHQGRERHRRSRDVAPGRGDEPGARKLMPRQLRHSVDEAAEQLRSPVLEPVPDRVQRGVLEAEVAPEVDHERDACCERRNQVLGPTRRQGDEDGVQSRTSRLHPGARTASRHIREQGSGRALPPGCPLSCRLAPLDLEAWVTRQQAQQLGSEIARRPRDSYPHRMMIQLTSIYAIGRRSRGALTAAPADRTRSCGSLARLGPPDAQAVTSRRMKTSIVITTAPTR